MNLLKSFFKKSEKTAELKQEVKVNYIYSINELKAIYNNHRNASELERKVLDFAMWDRARRANYHGYAPEFDNVTVIDGEILRGYCVEYTETDGRRARCSFVSLAICNNSSREAYNEACRAASCSNLIGATVKPYFN